MGAALRACFFINPPRLCTSRVAVARHGAQLPSAISLSLCDVRGLRSFLSLDDFELHSVSLGE